MNILIFGSSFSGSTVLSGMLGAHSQIQTLGEVYQWYLWHRGLRPDTDDYFRRETLSSAFLENLTYCRWCGPSCEKWASAPGLDDPRGLYRKLRDHFGKRFIVCSSKHPHWFEHIIPLCTEDNYRIVLLHKPVWSMLTSRARYMGLSSSAELSDYEFDGHVLFWCYFYRGFRDIIRKYAMESITENVFYEDLVHHPEQTLQRIISPLGLQVETGMETGFTMRHHEIAGNSKLKSSIENAKTPVHLTLDPQLNEAPQSVRDRALAHEDARELMAWLGR